MDEDAGVGGGADQAGGGAMLRSLVALVTGFPVPDTGNTLFDTCRTFSRAGCAAIFLVEIMVIMNWPPVTFHDYLFLYLKAMLGVVIWSGACFSVWVALEFRRYRKGRG